MASLTINVEADALEDAVVALNDIHRRLVKFHGDDSRRLERQIEAYAEKPQLQVHHLDVGHFFVVPGPAFTAILREARRLGVIA